MVKRQRTKGQTTQWSKDKGQKDRQHNGQKTKDKRTESNRKLTNIQNVFQILFPRVVEDFISTHPLHLFICRYTVQVRKDTYIRLRIQMNRMGQVNIAMYTMIKHWTGTGKYSQVYNDQTLDRDR
jgi:hypothetical protein